MKKKELVLGNKNKNNTDSTVTATANHYMKPTSSFSQDFAHRRKLPWVYHDSSHASYNNYTVRLEPITMLPLIRLKN